MTATLRVENFLGIQSAELDAAPFTLLIGPTASGKSVLARLLFYFVRMPNKVLSAAIRGIGEEDIVRELTREFTELFALGPQATPRFSAAYEYDGLRLRVSGSSDGSGCGLELPEGFASGYGRLQRDVAVMRAPLTGPAPPTTDPGRRYREAFDTHLGALLPAEHFPGVVFVPSGRIYYSHLRQNLFTLLAANHALDPTMLSFGEALDWAKKSAASIATGSGFATETANALRDLLRGTYRQDGGVERLEGTDGRTVEIRFLSSGQQELLPLALLLQAQVARGADGAEDTLYLVEEPEAHLDPATLKSLVDLVARIHAQAGLRTRFLLTTHSPYLLTTANNLLERGFAHSGRNGSGEGGPAHLSPGGVRAYALRDGRAESIMDPETGLINAVDFDAVAARLAAEFDELLELRG